MSYTLNRAYRLLFTLAAVFAKSDAMSTAELPIPAKQSTAKNH